MGILDQLKGLFAPKGGRGDPNALWLYVRCGHCGAPLAVRIDTRNELSVDYERGGYVLQKEMMDDKCFTLMHAHVRLDAQKNMVERTIDKGEFITREQYEAMKQ
jgi:hypothetical protein